MSPECYDAFESLKDFIIWIILIALVCFAARGLECAAHEMIAVVDEYKAASK